MTWMEDIRDAALALGFCRVGFTPVEPLGRSARALDAWLAAGRHGEMDYMAAHGRRDEPDKVLHGTKSLIVVALAYGGEGAPPPSSSDDPRPRGFVARYARGADYHFVLKEKLARLADACAGIVGRPVVARPCVDTAPLLERGYAERAGVGFTAKSTMTLAPGIGTYFLLGELLLDVELPPSPPVAPRCGGCTRCLDACPTGAFVSPYVLDARRCISYLTIELRGAIPRELRPLMGTMIFGCDICQEVCPFNASRRPRPVAPELRPRSEVSAPLLSNLLLMGSAAHRRLVRGSAMARASRQQLARNAAVALGNSGDRVHAVPPLITALQTHSHPLVRGHAAWALGHLGGADAVSALSLAASTEQNPDVLDEIRQALNESATATATTTATAMATGVPSAASPG
jgi:epoxyqueuosine reductase